MKRVILSLHGFPGPAGIYEEGTIFFIDELKKVAIEKECELLHPSYPGILDDSEFNFQKSLEYTKQLVSKVIEDYDEVTIIARSFGGMALLFALKDLRGYSEKVKHLLFITPLIQLPPMKNAQIIISDTYVKAPGLLDPTKADQYLSQIENIGNTFRPFEIFNSESFQVTPVFIGAEADETTPAAYISKFAQLTGSIYISISGGHDLGDKKEVMQEISRILD